MVLGNAMHSTVHACTPPPKVYMLSAECSGKPNRVKSQGRQHGQEQPNIQAEHVPSKLHHSVHGHQGGQHLLLGI